MLTQKNPQNEEPPPIPFDSRFQTSLNSSPLFLPSETTSIKNKLNSASLQTRIVTNIDECRELWNDFSPSATIYDIWEFRLAFYKAYQHQPYFVVLLDESKPVGLLPLWYDSDKNEFDWFGSYWHEHNNFWVSQAKYLPHLLNAIPSPFKLSAICSSTVEKITQFPQGLRLEEDDPTFAQNLEGCNNHDDFLVSLKKKTRYNLKRDWNKIQEFNPQIFLNRFDDLDTLIKLNTQRFLDKKTDEPDCLDKRRAQTFYNLVDAALVTKSFQVRMISIEIDGKIAVTDLIAIYKNTYYSLKGGSDIRNFPGIGNYINLLEIDDACSLGLKKIDFLQSPGGWKNKWFKPEKLFKLSSV